MVFQSPHMATRGGESDRVSPPKAKEEGLRDVSN